MYKTTKFISKDVCIFKINPHDLYESQFGIFILEQCKHYKLSKGIFDLSLFEVLVSSDIRAVEKLVALLKLNNIKSVVCGILPQCASILPHFVEDVSFQTTLGIKEALDVF